MLCSVFCCNYLLIFLRRTSKTIFPIFYWSYCILRLQSIIDGLFIIIIIIRDYCIIIFINRFCSHWIRSGWPCLWASILLWFRSEIEHSSNSHPFRNYSTVHLPVFPCVNFWPPSTYPLLTVHICTISSRATVRRGLFSSKRSPFPVAQACIMVSFCSKGAWLKLYPFSMRCYIPSQKCIIFFTIHPSLLASFIRHSRFPQ